MNNHKIPFSIYRGTKMKQRAEGSAKYAFHCNSEVSFYCESFSQYRGGKYPSLYRGQLYMEVRYIEVSGSAASTKVQDRSLVVVVCELDM